MEKINLVELLKDCPIGMELDCTMYNKVTLMNVDKDKNAIFPIRVMREDGNHTTLTKYGQFTDADFAKCVIFPKGKTTWEGFKRPFKDGDVVFYNDTISIFKEWGDKTLFRSYVTTYLYCDFIIDTNVPLFGKSIRSEIRLATEKETEKLFNAIKTNGYKWNAETKTLEKLVKPKFKVGNKIKLKAGEEFGFITQVTDCFYTIKNHNHTHYWPIQKQDDWELVPDKLKPFDKVLVRGSSLGKWHIQFFERYDKNASEQQFVCLGGSRYGECIPYEGNEYLLNPTDNCDKV